MICVEIYGAINPDELLADIYAPEGGEKTCAYTVGRMLCRMWGRDTVIAALVDEKGETREKLIVYKDKKKRGKE